MSTLVNALHIPSELRARPQWVSWRYVFVAGQTKPTKVLLNSRTGYNASVSDSATWSNFQTAESVVTQCDGVGYVFSNNDPYCGIDFDNVNKNPQPIIDAHNKIYTTLNSYSEWSPSGDGIHTIIKAAVPTGRNSRSKMMEIYSSGRFFTFTGNVINNVPIMERQELAMQLWAELGGQSSEVAVIERPQSVDDAAIYDIASHADNSEKFLSLWEGRWMGAYPSQSEADQALIDILQFYTKNVEQITRLFRASGLGRRDKAKRDDYVMRTIRRSFDRELPMVNIDYGASQNANGKNENDSVSVNGMVDNSAHGHIPIKLEVPKETNGAHSNGHHANALVPVIKRIDINATVNPFTHKPPGLVGEIAEFIFHAAPRPIQEAAIAAAIVMMAGICGKAWNISGAGLNQYLLFIAQAGTGKDAINTGISKLMTRLEAEMPTIAGFQGPSYFASGQALYKFISTSPTGGSNFSIFGEFGLRLQMISKDNASSAEQMFKSNLLDLYTRSGATNKSHGTMYANKENNVKGFTGAAFSMLGEGEPTGFYGKLEEGDITSGLIPRYIFVEYLGGRPARNESAHMVEPSRVVLDGIRNVAEMALKRIQSNNIEDVPMTPEARQLESLYNDECDKRINNSTRAVVRVIWSRAWMKAMKLAALFAIGKDYVHPTIDEQCFNYARNIVEYESGELVEKLRKGDLTRDSVNYEQDQILIISKLMHDWRATNYYGCGFGRTSIEMHMAGVVAYSDVMMKTAGLTCFKKDRFKDHTKKLERALEQLKMMGFIDEVNTNELGQRIARAIRIADVDGLANYVAKWE